VDLPRWGAQAPQPFDNGGDATRGGFSGSKLKSIDKGHFVEFRLRKGADPDGTVLAAVTVTTDVSTLPPVGVEVFNPAELARGQGIYSLWVDPGVDSVAMSFKTRQATNPFIEVFNQHTGELADLWMRPEKITTHSMVFKGYGIGKAMAQDTRHTYRIVANALPGSVGPSKVEETGSFRTGARSATVFFDNIHMRLDGDPNSPGDFTFGFGAGDVDTQELLGDAYYGNDIAIKDGHIEVVNRAITIPSPAPPMLWVQVTSVEDDFVFPSGLAVVGVQPTFAPPGSHVIEDTDFVAVDVTEHFDISQSLEKTITPFQMSTGNFAVAFWVNGRLMVEARNGVWLSGVLFKPAPQGSVKLSVHTLSAPHGQSKLFIGPEGHAHKLILTPDGAVYHQALGYDLLASRNGASRNGRWTNLGGQFEGPLTVVAGDSDRISLFGLSRDGAVLYKSHTPDVGPDYYWQTLGGDFVGPVTAVVGEDGAIELFAMNEQGSVFYLRLADPQGEQPRGEWEFLGGEIGGSIAALYSPRSGLSVFVLDRGGEILYKRRPPNEEEWQPAGERWDTLGVASAGSLIAEWVGDESLLVAVIAEEDETVRILAWPDYPDVPPPEGWKVIGTLNDVLQGRIPEGEEPTVLDEAKGAEYSRGASGAS
jgi:hypothetical protein